MIEIYCAAVLAVAAPEESAQEIAGQVCAHWQDDPCAIDPHPLVAAAFIAQTAHETDRYRTLTEYADGSAYEERADLGNTRPGDGPRYRGRGLIQTTGRYNYSRIGFETEPGRLAQWPWAWESAVAYWQRHDLSRLARRGRIDAITRAVNGGVNGLQKRRTLFLRAQTAIEQAVYARLDLDPGPVDGLRGDRTRAAQRRAWDECHLSPGAILALDLPEG